MTEDAGVQAIFEALGLPPEACVDARVPKKLLVEQGAPTPADKRAIQDGIDELRKEGRLIELIHRAIPYPVMLVTSDADGVALSVAHKRRAQNEEGKVVIERVVSVSALSAKPQRPEECEFMEALSLARQPRLDLCTLYEGWLTRIEALNAARLNGVFTATDDEASIVRRRDANPNQWLYSAAQTTFVSRGVYGAISRGPCNDAQH